MVSLMLFLFLGISVTAFGVCLIFDVKELATRMLSFYSSFMDVGTATPGKIRFVGVFGVVVGIGAIAASFSAK
jgi:hypothetical protein